MIRLFAVRHVGINVLTVQNYTTNYKHVLMPTCNNLSYSAAHARTCAIYKLHGCPRIHLGHQQTNAFESGGASVKIS